MKELNTHLKRKETIEIQSKKNNQQEAELVLNGVISPKAGHTLFEVNSITKEVTPARFNNKKEIDFLKAQRGDYSGINDLIMNENCVYIPALNKANALKKFEKDPNQSSYYRKEALMSLTETFF